MVLLVNVQTYHNPPTTKNVDENINTLYLSLPFVGQTGEHIVRKCKRNLYKCFKNDTKVIFRVNFKTTKLLFFHLLKTGPHCLVIRLLYTSSNAPVAASLMQEKHNVRYFKEHQSMDGNKRPVPSLLILIVVMTTTILKTYIKSWSTI